MAIDKQQSPLWVRIVVIVLVVGLIAGIGILGVGSVISTWTNSPGANYQDVTAEEASGIMAEIDARYQAQVDELRAKVDANPEDKDAVIALATAYYNWAIELSQINDDTAMLMAQVQVMQSLQYWQQAGELDPSDENVQQMIQGIQEMLGDSVVTGGDGATTDAGTDAQTQE